MLDVVRKPLFVLCRRDQTPPNILVHMDLCGMRWLFHSYHRQDIGTFQHGEVNDWCRERFGPREAATEGPGRWIAFESNGAFLFRDDQDAFDFRLRWT